jgi:aminopeptidase YwaD
VQEVSVDNIAQEAIAHVRRLSVDIGPRPLGSPGNRAAADYIEAVFQNAGLQVERQPFPCIDWDCEETVLELDGRRLEAAANWFSPSCDVAGALVPVATLDALERADLAGRVPLLYGDLTHDTVTPKRFTFYNPEHHQRIVRALEEKRPTAVITVSMALPLLNRLIKDADLDIPSATVPPGVGVELLRCAGDPLRLRIVTSRSPGQACNVVGRKAGPGPERVVVCAHYDTVWDTPGAVDNGAGVAVMLTLARLLAGRELAVGLECIAINGEDCCGQGDEAYLRIHGLSFAPPVWGGEPRRSRALDPVLALINADGVGQALGLNNVTTVGGSKPFDDLVEGIRREHHPQVAWVDPWYASDHTAYFAHGVPCIPLGSRGVEGIEHTRRDTIEWVGPTRLAEAVSLAADLVEALQDKSSDWCRPSGPE